MKVFTCKMLIFCLALMPATSLVAGSWLDYCLPSWMAKPVSWVKEYISPYMPATISDAQRVKKPIEENIKSADVLLKAVHEVQQERTLPQSLALKEDLEWLDRRIQHTQAENTAFFNTAADKISVLKKGQETTSVDLEQVSARAMALYREFYEADEYIEKAIAKFTQQQHQSVQTLAAFGVASSQRLAQLTQQVDDYCKGLSASDSRIEKDLSSLHQKTTASLNTLDKIIETNISNREKLGKLEQFYKETLLRVNLLIEAKRRKKENKRRSQNSVPAMLLQAVDKS